MAEYAATEYGEYLLIPRPSKTQNDRWAVGVKIQRTSHERLQSEMFRAEDGITYMLAIEAVKECINLGRNLIDRGVVAF